MWIPDEDEPPSINPRTPTPILPFCLDLPRLVHYIFLLSFLLLWALFVVFRGKRAWGIELGTNEEGNEITPTKSTPHMFCKTLTASDTSTHGWFSVPRRAAKTVFLVWCDTSHVLVLNF